MRRGRKHTHVRPQLRDHRPAHHLINAGHRIQQRALSLLTTTKLKAAFDLDTVDPRLRDRYDRTLFGSSALIARRLVEGATQAPGRSRGRAAPRPAPRPPFRAANSRSNTITSGLVREQ